MGTMTKIAITSAIGVAMLSGTVSAAVTPAMQKAANQETRAITKAVNVSNASIQCKQAALRIAKAAKAAAGPNAKGAALHADVANAVSAAAGKFNIAQGCITPVMASNSASTVTGVKSATGPAMGLAKAGGLAGAAGAGAAGAAGAAAAGAAAVGGIGVIGAVAGLAGLAAVASAVNDDDDASPGT